MACDLSLGRKEPCKDVVGGIKNVYFADFGDFSTIVYVSGTDVIDTLGSGLTVLQYDVKGNSSFVQNITSSFGYFSLTL